MKRRQTQKRLNTTPEHQGCNQTPIPIALFAWTLPLEGHILTEDADSNSGNGHTEFSYIFEKWARQKVFNLKSEIFTEL